MLGGIGAFLASEISGAVRRNVIVYALFGIAALLVLCAGGYALSALHTVLALRYGTAEASLIIAGGLLVAALLAFGLGLYVKNRRRPARPLAATALVAAPLAAKLIGSGMASRKGWRVALVGGVVVLGALLGRQFFTGSAADDDEA
jgi:peptidoglycan/LPS O-acetylase OafA/YrhL